MSSVPSKRSLTMGLAPKAPSVMQKISEGKMVEEGFDVLR